jgi:small subunit ribosomal protein S5
MARNNRKEFKKIGEDREFDQEIIEIARVTRVTAGGKRMRFRACVVIGDKKGQVGTAICKGADVTIAVNKAVNAAKKNLIKVNIINDTIAHRIIEKFGAAVVLLKPAPKGAGIIAGGPVRAVISLAGIKNISSKMMGSKNKINNVRATINALMKLQDEKVLRGLRQ